MAIFGLLIGFMVLLSGITALASVTFELFGPVLIAIGVVRILTSLKARRAQEDSEDPKDSFEHYHFKDEAEILAEKYEKNMY